MRHRLAPFTTLPSAKIESTAELPRILKPLGRKPLIVGQVGAV
jgi:hypothetical protein